MRILTRYVVLELLQVYLLALTALTSLMLIVAVLYWKLTQDCPQGDYVELRALGVEVESGKKGGWAVFKKAMGNYRAWMLFVTYGACFGTELFVHNVAASYYVDRFKLDLQSAGLAAGSFGLLALFARASYSAAMAGAGAGRSEALRSSRAFS